MEQAEVCGEAGVCGNAISISYMGMERITNIQKAIEEALDFVSISYMGMEQYPGYDRLVDFHREYQSPIWVWNDCRGVKS